MSLLAYNKTAAPLALAAGVPVVTLPASASADARGPAFNVTSELKGLTAPQYAALQAQVAAGDVDYEWTTLPEYNTYTLVVGSSAYSLAENDVVVVVDPVLGNDANPGTPTAPVQTFTRGLQLLPTEYMRSCRLYLRPGTHVAPSETYQQMPRAIGPFGSTFIIMADPASALTQLAAGTETTGGLVRTLTDAAAPFGAVDSLFGYWVRVTSGPNAGQRAEIKSNTASVIQLMTDLPLAMVIGNTFVIEKPSGILSCNLWRPNYTALAFKDIAISLVNGSAAVPNFMLTTAPTFLCACEIIYQGANAFMTVLYGETVAASGFFRTWAMEGASSPFPTTAEDNAGIRISGIGGGTVVRASNFNQGSVVAQDGAVTLSVEGQSAVGVHGTTPIVFASKSTGQITVRESYLNIGGASTNNRGRVDSPILVEANSTALIGNTDHNGVLAVSAIRAARNSYVRLTAVQGAGNGNYGVELVSLDSVVEVTDNNTTISGLNGEIKCGTRPVRTWADFRNAAPPSGLPSKNEHDAPAFGARPFRLTFAGMPAAASFDITTLAAFTTPAGATSGASSIWQTSPPAMFNASSLRVTGVGTAVLGDRVFTDSAGTPTAPAGGAPGIARISDDGKTITFEGTVTDFVLEYTPVSGTTTGCHIQQIP